MLSYVPFYDASSLSVEEEEIDDAEDGEDEGDDEEERPPLYMRRTKAGNYKATGWR